MVSIDEVLNEIDKQGYSVKISELNEYLQSLVNVYNLLNYKSYKNLKHNSAKRRLKAFIRKEFMNQKHKCLNCGMEGKTYLHFTKDKTYQICDNCYVDEIGFVK